VVEVNRDKRGLGEICAGPDPAVKKANAAGRTGDWEDRQYLLGVYCGKL